MPRNALLCISVSEGCESSASRLDESMPQMSAPPNRFFFKGQIVHLSLLLILLVAVGQLTAFKPLRANRLLGVGADVWFIVALGVPIVHQVYVWLAWRSELCFRGLTHRLGPHAFVIYQVVFMVCLLSRPVSLTLLAIADHDSFALASPARLVICAILAIPAVYTLYSVVRYFGMARAAGIDHFDPSYRSKPLVKQGAFKYVSNSMYSFGFLLLWVIAIGGASWAAIVVALFSHVYIWVHYYCTERPDMKIIYGT